MCLGGVGVSRCGCVSGVCVGGGVRPGSGGRSRGSHAPTAEEAPYSPPHARRPHDQGDHVTKPTQWESGPPSPATGSSRTGQGEAPSPLPIHTAGGPSTLTLFFTFCCSTASLSSVASFSRHHTCDSSSMRLRGDGGVTAGLQGPAAAIGPVSGSLPLPRNTRGAWGCGQSPPQAGTGFRGASAATGAPPLRAGSPEASAVPLGGTGCGDGSGQSCHNGQRGDAPWTVRFPGALSSAELSLVPLCPAARVGWPFPAATAAPRDWAGPPWRTPGPEARVAPWPVAGTPINCIPALGAGTTLCPKPNSAETRRLPLSPAPGLQGISPRRPRMRAAGRPGGPSFHTSLRTRGPAAPSTPSPGKRGVDALELLWLL